VSGEVAKAQEMSTGHDVAIAVIRVNAITVPENGGEELARRSVSV